MLTSKNEPNIFEQYYFGRSSDFSVHPILKINRSLKERESGVHSHALQLTFDLSPSK